MVVGKEDAFAVGRTTWSSEKVLRLFESRRTVWEVLKYGELLAVVSLSIIACDLAGWMTCHETSF